MLVAIPIIRDFPNSTLDKWTKPVIPPRGPAFCKAKIPNSGREQAEIPLLELHEYLHDLFDVGDPRRGLDRRKSLQDFRGTKLPEDNLRRYAKFQDIYNKYILIIIE